MNKPGGVAWVLNVHEDILDTGGHPVRISRRYDLKYIVGGRKDFDVAGEFIEAHEDLERTSRKRGLISGNDNSTEERSARKKLQEPKKELLQKERFSEKCTLQGQRKIITSHDIFILATSLDHADFLKLEHFIISFSSHANTSTSSLSTRSSTSSSFPSTSSSFSSSRYFLDNNALDMTASTPSITLSEIFDKNVTHVVVSVDKFKILKGRTLKFMQAIMG